VEIVSRPHARNLVAFAASRPELLVLSADLTSSCEANDFRDAYPERFFSFGVAEQNMLGFAAGLAREGFSPWVHTFAVFICRRAFDQVAMSIAYPNLKVRLVGFLPGITTPGGVTHQAIDDVALMRLLPNVTVLGCGDATEVEGVLAAAEAVDGPVYIRMLRGEVPRLFDPREPFRVGRARVLSRGADLAVVSEGICTEEALRACRAIARRGVGISHLHVSTFKPFADAGVLDACAAAGRGVISVENHSVVGGLGTALAERLAEAGCPARLVRLGLQDVYAHGASRSYLMREHGLDALAIAAAAERLLGAPLGIDEAELRAVDLAPVRGESLPEEL
jgi:transketolase